MKTILTLSTFFTTERNNAPRELGRPSALLVTESFHRWLGEYLVAIPTGHVATEDSDLFKRLASLVKDVHPPGTANKTTVEGRLLFSLLEARISNQKVLDPIILQAAVQTLSSSFMRPTRQEDDILGQDTLAIRHARVLWSLLGNISATDEFWVWSGEVLGRAYAASGVVDPTLTKEHSDDLFEPPESGKSSVGSSRSIIVQKLRKLLGGDNTVAVSLAEKTLRQLVTSAARKRSLNDYEESLGPDLLRALKLHPSPLPDTDRPGYYTPLRDIPMMSHRTSSMAGWASQFLLSLAAPVKEDPLLCALPAILQNLPELAVRIMPFTVKAVLEVDFKDGLFHRQLISQTFRDLLVDLNGTGSYQRRLILGTLYTFVASLGQMKRP